MSFTTKTANVLARVEPDVKEGFDAMMGKGLEQAKANEGRIAEDVLADVRNSIKECSR